MALYAVIDTTNTVVNSPVLWDGITPWSPGPGLTVVPDTNPPTAQTGGTYVPATQTFLPPAE